MTSHRLLPWEYRELADELEANSRWEFTGSSWIYCSDEGDALFGLRVTRGTGPFASIRLDVFHANWTQADAEAYASNILRWWTGYSQRIEVAARLMEHLHLDPGKAQAMAVLVAQVYHADIPKPADPPTQFLLHGPVEPPPEPQDRERVFHLQGGGWIKVAYHGEQFSVRLSIPSATGGFLHPFRGYIHNEHTRRDVAAAAIFGWRDHGRDTQTNSLRADQAPSQGRLPGGDEPGIQGGDGQDETGRLPSRDPAPGTGESTDGSPGTGPVLRQGDGDPTLHPVAPDGGADHEPGPEQV